MASISPTTFGVTGTGFAPNTTVGINIMGPNDPSAWYYNFVTNADSNGNINASFSSSFLSTYAQTLANSGGGTATFYVYAIESSGQQSNTVQFTLNVPKTQVVESITLYTPSVSGNTVTINGLATGNPSYITWNWGDGTTTTSWFPASHTYAYGGSYTVTATAYYPDGDQAVQSVTVNIPTSSSSGSGGGSSGSGGGSSSGSSGGSSSSSTYNMNIAISPTAITLTQGATVYISGSGFPPNSKGYIAAVPSDIGLAGFTADSNGNFNVSIQYYFNQNQVSGLGNAIYDATGNSIGIRAYDYANGQYSNTVTLYFSNG